MDIDYLALPVEPGDVFLLTTDGVHDHLDPRFAAAAVTRHHDDLDGAARAIIDEALRRGSADNLTALILRIDALPRPQAGEALRRRDTLPLPPRLEPRMNFDGYTILRELHVSHRSHIHLARDDASGERVAIKTPSIELRDDPAYLERFLLEEWVARRIDSPHALHARPPAPRDAAPGPAARQHHDRCRRHGPHRRLRQRACRGLAEAGDRDATEILGTEQYTAPEYFLGEGGTPRSDQFSLGVITYQMLSGGLPYGARVSRLRSHAALTHPVAFWKGLTLALAAALLGLLYAWVMRA